MFHIRAWCAQGTGQAGARVQNRPDWKERLTRAHVQDKAHLQALCVHIHSVRVPAAPTPLRVL